MDRIRVRYLKVALMVGLLGSVGGVPAWGEGGSMMTSSQTPYLSDAGVRLRWSQGDRPIITAIYAAPGSGGGGAGVGNAGRENRIGPGTLRSLASVPYGYKSIDRDDGRRSKNVRSGNGSGSGSRRNLPFFPMGPFVNPNNDGSGGDGLIIVNDLSTQGSRSVDASDEVVFPGQDDPGSGDDGGLSINNPDGLSGGGSGGGSSPSSNVVPEPGVLGMIGIGILGLLTRKQGRSGS